MPIYTTKQHRDGKRKYRIVVNYTDSDGAYKKKEKTAYGYDAAHELEQLMQMQYRQPMEAMGELRFADFFDEYIKYKQHECRETTIEKQKEIVRNHILPYFGNVTMTDITAQMVVAWKNELNGTDLGITMKQHCYTQLQAVLNFAQNIEAIHENPTFKIGNFKNAYFEMPEEKIQYYTPDEFICFISTAKESISSFFQWGVWIFFCLAYYTGMRKGEIHALKWSDIGSGKIHVRRSVSQKVAGKSIIEAPPKNQSSFRTIQIPEPLEIALQEHRQRQQEYFPTWSEDYRVCGGDKCISDTTISNYNRRWAKAAGLRVLRIHDYRHSHATLLANEGINIQEVARRLGHSNVQVTWKRYAHLYPREEERAIAVLNKIAF